MHLLGLASEFSTNVCNGHALPLGAGGSACADTQGAPGPSLIGLQPRIRLDEMVADFPQDGGEENVGDRERLAGDPFAAVKLALQPGEPAAGFLDQRRPPRSSPLAAHAAVDHLDLEQRTLDGGERGEAPLYDPRASGEV